MGIEVHAKVDDDGNVFGIEDGDGCTESELLRMLGLLKMISGKFEKELNERWDAEEPSVDKAEEKKALIAS